MAKKCPFCQRRDGLGLSSSLKTIYLMVSVQSICDAATHDEEPTVETTEAFFPVRSKTELKSEGFSRRCLAASNRVVLRLEAAGWQHIQNLTKFVIVWTSEKFSLSFKPLRNWCSFCVTPEHDAAERNWMFLALRIISIFLPRRRPAVLGGYSLLHVSSIREKSFAPRPKILCGSESKWWSARV